MLQDTLNQISELQLVYSSDNTPEMAERGNLIRHQLRADLEPYRKDFAAALKIPVEDLLFDASDGLGRKSRSPWFRICSKELSPTAREGYYMVIHFSLDGERYYVTLGCSSTVLKKGSLDSIPDELLAKKTTPLSPPSDPVQRRLQSPPAKSKFLAVVKLTGKDLIMSMVQHVIIVV
ncbi:DUF3578 domain-containing protein [Akkermansiaceae bacterium]|nr:DUF3578 domain-containing protein [Akkermansiaceae bacterium]MDA7611641.1 DUF3578 domain-containing protein [bacterium]MDA7518681.1 DUF3578 domain-containing protein [Akkermansiaceae bacterium]MDA7650945.1 DUF3578 domain-containing protein [Akkermansiaceae bacterium]MDA7674943.1 DUF3578 domain-containing protein [Akkermansiaceae bacterium]